MMSKFSIVTGTLIRRHRVSRPIPNDDRYYTAEDFDIGNEVNKFSFFYLLLIILIW